MTGALADRLLMPGVKVQHFARSALLSSLLTATMHSQCATLAAFAVAILATVAKPLAPPTTGWMYNEFLIWSTTATQCEPFYIFHNNTSGKYSFPLVDAPNTHALVSFTIPPGVGYLEWICNIPAGVAFLLVGQNYFVQAGSSSACLGDLTATYALLDYSTADFASYTRNPSLPTTPLPTFALPTASFPTGPFSTITLNPNLAVIPTAFSPSFSSPTFTTASSLSSYPPSSSTSSALSPYLPSSSTSSALSTHPPPSSTTPTNTSPSSPTMLPSPKPHISSVAGGVVGAVVFILLIIALRHLWRSRRKRRNDLQPAATSGLAIGELGSTYLSPPFQSSGAELPGPTPDPCSRGNEPQSDSSIIVPVTGNPVAGVVPVAQSLVALSPADIESTTGTPPATLSTQQAYDHSIINAGRDIGSHNVTIGSQNVTINSLHIHQAQPGPRSSL